MNLREERNFLDLPDSCVTMIKDLRRSSCSNTRSDLRKRPAIATVMEVLMRLSGGRVSLSMSNTMYVVGLELGSRIQLLVNVQDVDYTNVTLTQLVHYVVNLLKLQSISSSTAKQPEHYGLVVIGDSTLMNYISRPLDNSLIYCYSLILLLFLWTLKGKLSYYSGAIKINCDTAIGQDKAYLAIRDIGITMSKRVETNIPVQAETEAINWAVPPLVTHNIHKTIVESDAKVCIEAMLESSSRPPWIIEQSYDRRSAEPNFDQTENKISASKEIKGPAEAVATAREPHDSPMPKEVRKEWTCDICQLTTKVRKT
ncbi:hypothetical protein CFP56_019585 [Quercus suber]|uniref:RNase H type-1 domain-containing protein n=1 Tax=Quercus suber TaxID=58331 RepID=A0AAW0KIN9_QUESU